MLVGTSWMCSIQTMGVEFISTKFEEFLKPERAIHECTVPNKPEWKGVVERLIKLNLGKEF